MATLSDVKYQRYFTFNSFTNDVIYGTAEDDIVRIYGGNDVFIDIAGGDDIVYDISSYGSAFASRGWSGKDVISTGTGNDIVSSSLNSSSNAALRGGQEYYGGLGFDTLNFSPNWTGVYVDLVSNQAVNLATGEATRVVSFERVTGSNLNDQIFGSDDDNILRGLSGDDKIMGRGGDDLLEGGDGQDRLYGNLGDDTLGGGNGDDTLYGGAGDDVVEGEAGNDLLLGEAGNDDIQGQAGNDIAKGGLGNDALYGQGGNDNLDGGAGTDAIFGGLGRDLLSGGADRDFFLYETVNDSIPGASADTIFDFEHGIDLMSVDFIDANINVTGDQAFRFIGNNNFSGAGQIKSHWDAAQNATVLEFNTDSDAAAEMMIKLSGHINVSSLDFIL